MLKVLKKGVVINDEGEFISPIFLRSNPDGTNRVIFHHVLKVYLKDAYYSMKIVVLPNGLSSGPTNFTKLRKSSIAILRLEETIITIYIDDLIILREAYEEYLTGSIKAIKIFLCLGFLIHPDKSTCLSTLK